MQIRIKSPHKEIKMLGATTLALLILLLSFPLHSFGQVDEDAPQLQVVYPMSTLVTSDHLIPITILAPAGESFSIIEGTAVKATGVGVGANQPVTVKVILTEPGLHSLIAKLDASTSSILLPPIYTTNLSQSFDISNVVQHIQLMNDMPGVWSPTAQTQNVNALLGLISTQQIQTPIHNLSTINVAATRALFTFSPVFGATSIQLKQSIDGENWTASSTSQALNNGSTSTEALNLSPEQTYHFKIEVIGGTYAGDSNIIDITTPGDVMNFNGVSDYVKFPNSDALNPDSITIEAWIKPQALQRLAGIVSKFQKHTDLDRASYSLRLSDNYPDYNRINFVYNNDGYGNSEITSSTTLQANRWYHVTAVYDNTAHKVYIYINGLMDSMQENVITPLGKNSTDLRIGVDYAEATDQVGRYFKGAIREVRIWNVARTPEQILANMNNFDLSPVSEPHLILMEHLGLPPQ